MTSLPIMKIGTRASPLAMAQTNEAGRLLSKAFPELAEDGAIQTVVVSTTGDQVQDRPLAELGGKGLFSKELDRAMIDGDIDVAVHSLKDLETTFPEGIVLAAVMEREDVRDVLISATGKTLEQLPNGAVIGTASLRRRSQLMAMRPDFECVLIRGNVQTRLKKLAAGDVDATLLALAGLNRLGMADKATEILPTNMLLPAVAQGAIGITCRTDDGRIQDYVSVLNHKQTGICVAAERAMLKALDGSCRTPIGGLATLNDDGSLNLIGRIGHPDGTGLVECEQNGGWEDGIALGLEVGAELRSLADPELFQ